MISLTKIEPPILFPRPNVLADRDAQFSGIDGKWDQPDIKKNPKFWVKLYLEGLTLHRRSFALASRAENVLDLGCGSGWFSVALAKSRTDVRVEAVDNDGRVLDWGRYYMERMASEGKALGRVRFSEADVEDFPWHKYEEEFDLVNASFILSRLDNPAEALNGIYKCLKPGGWLIYYDATDPPSRNLNRIARLHHFLVKWKDDSSDPWAWRRVWERKYKFDVLRARARSSEPEETEVVRRLEELFAIRYQERRRAFLDLFLSARNKSLSKNSAFIPFIKLADDFLCWTNLLVGSSRYILGQKR